jgi:hypothetical protein
MVLVLVWKKTGTESPGVRNDETGEPFPVAGGGRRCQAAAAGEHEARTAATTTLNI